MISYLRSSTYRLPYRPKLPSRYRLPHPPLLLLRPYLWPHSLTCASLPLLYPQPHTTSPTAAPTTSFTGFNRSPRRSTHSTCHLLAIRASISSAYEAGKTLLLGAFKLSSRAVPYLLSFGWGQRYKIITRNGIAPLCGHRLLFCTFA
jgi:hypothetical protein